MDTPQKEFFESLTKTIKDLQNQNRDLLDQVAQTNTDLMQVGFRMDMLSGSLRPMPVSEDRLDMTLDGDIGAGVLPPRAEPLYLPTQE